MKRELIIQLRRSRQVRHFTLLLVLSAAFGLTAAYAAGSTPLPKRGQTMKQVIQHRGRPVDRGAPVGQPPITRWEYPGFVVVFEHNLVIDSFQPGSMPTIYHRDRLARVHP